MNLDNGDGQLYMEGMINYIQSRMSFGSLIEIAIIAYLIYTLLHWIHGSQAEQVIKGLIVVLVLIPVCSWLRFTTLSYLLNSLFTWGIIIFFVVFQPEMRSALQQLGNNRLFKRFIRDTDSKAMDKGFEAIGDAVSHLSEAKIGALIVCETNTGLKDIAASGVTLNADITADLLENIFTPNRPLHDGAVILNPRSGKIIAAGCLLPLTNRHNLDTTLGTRHRSAIGISEQSDALTIVVSEETGSVSYTEGGEIVRHVPVAQLIDHLKTHYSDASNAAENADKSRMLNIRGDGRE